MRSNFCGKCFEKPKKVIFRFTTTTPVQELFQNPIEATAQGAVTRENLMIQVFRSLELHIIIQKNSGNNESI
jgi:hypothetical protein